MQYHARSSLFKNSVYLVKYLNPENEYIPIIWLYIALSLRWALASMHVGISRSEQFDVECSYHSDEFTDEIQPSIDKVVF